MALGTNVKKKSEEDQEVSNDTSSAQIEKSQQLKNHKSKKSTDEEIQRQCSSILCL